jgi:hypothetical protein
MRFEDWMVLIAGLCYTAAAVKHGWNLNFMWLTVWASYAIANFALTYIQLKG